MKKNRTVKFGKDVHIGLRMTAGEYAALTLMCEREAQGMSSMLRTLIREGAENRFLPPLGELAKVGDGRL